MATHLNNHHRRTLAKIFEHGTSTNLEWRQARSLLEAVGTVTVEHNGHLKVTIGPETEVFHDFGEKDVGSAIGSRYAPHARPGGPGARRIARQRR